MSYDASKYHGPDARWWERAPRPVVPVLTPKQTNHYEDALEKLAVLFFEDAPEEATEEADVGDLILAFDVLTQRQKFVISLRFGLTDGYEYTYRAIADLMGYSDHKTVREIEAAALASLRKSLTPPELL